MQKYIGDSRFPTWVANATLPGSAFQRAQEKVFKFQRKHKLGAPRGVPISPIEERVIFYSQGLHCPCVGYPVEGCDLDEWGGLLFYEVENEEPQPDTDLLLGFPDGRGTAFIVTRRGTNRIRSEIVAN